MAPRFHPNYNDQNAQKRRYFVKKTKYRKIEKKLINRACVQENIAQN